VTESQLQSALLLHAPKSLPGIRLFRRNVIAARVGDRTVRAGIKGQCDLYGYIRGKGRVVEIEIKSSVGRLSPEQKTWAAWCAEWEVPHIVLTGAKGETTEETVERWCGELERFLMAL